MTSELRADAAARRRSATPPTSARRRTSNAASSRCSRPSSRRSSPRAYERADRRRQAARSAAAPRARRVRKHRPASRPARHSRRPARARASNSSRSSRTWPRSTPSTAATAPRRSSRTTARRSILSGIADPQTLDYVAALLGDEEVRQIVLDTRRRRRRSTTESFSYRTLAPANVLREMTPGQGVLVYGHLPPARIAMRPWFKDPQLRRAASGASRGAVQAERYREGHGREPHQLTPKRLEKPPRGTRRVTRCRASRRPSSTAIPNTDLPSRSGSSRRAGGMCSTSRASSRASRAATSRQAWSLLSPSRRHP